MKPKNHKILLITAIFAMFCCGVLSAQDHFVPVDKTGEYCAVVVNEAMINDSILEIGDEIGVFDDSLCVGTGVFEDDFPISCTAILRYISPNGDTLAGAERNNQIYFKIWQKATDQEADAVPTFVSGGNFGDVLTVVEPLEAVIENSNIDNDGSLKPEKYNLSQNFPNPFNPETTVSYILPASSRTRILIYNALGERIRTLVDEVKEAGCHSISWDGCDERGWRVCSGVYLMKMEADNFSETRKLLLVQ